MRNFKCVDYFQVEVYESDQGEPTLSDRINRHQTFLDLTIKPCTDYTFKVISSNGKMVLRLFSITMFSGGCLRGLARYER